MNYRGSYRHLLRNSTAALLSAIEIYNKPRIAYREECFVILLLNSWELVLKAILSKHNKSIFYPKTRGQPYRTLAWKDALDKAEKFFPSGIDPLPIRRNLDLLSTYRDNAVHFYNERAFGAVIYALAQTNIINIRDLLSKLFKMDLTDEITWSLLPLGAHMPVDPIEFLSAKSGTDEKKTSAAVRQFVSALRQSVEEVEAANLDTGRLLTVFNVKLESTKKIERADVVVGVTKPADGTGPIAVVRTLDPNRSHPLRLKDVLQQVPEAGGQKLTQHVFTALCRKFGLKDDPQYCWKASEGVLTRYSHDIVPRLKQFTKTETEAALAEYRAFFKAAGGRPKKIRDGA